MKHKNFWRVAQWIIGAVVIWLLARYVHRYWGEISGIKIRFCWMWAVAAVFLVILSNMIQVTLFQYFLKHNGLSITFVSAWRIYKLPQAGKYIPGKITAIAALSYMLKEAGLSLPHALAAILAFNVVSLLAGLLLGLTLLPAWAPYAGRTIVALCIGTAVLSVPAVCSRSFWRLTNHVLARYKRPTMPTYPSRSAMIRLMLGWIAYWVVIGAGMFAAASFFVEVPRALFPLLLAGLSLSYFISTVSFITPAGLGVREAVIMGMVGTASTAAFGAIFAAVTRLVMVLDDGVMIGGAWLVAPRLESPGNLTVAANQSDTPSGKEEWP